VLLGSVVLGRVAYGLTLIAAFALGLAAALVAVGVFALRARDLVERRLPHRIERVMPVACAAGMVAFGVALSARALSAL
jgi:nickel/cobalt exporter